MPVVCFSCDRSSSSLRRPKGNNMLPRFILLLCMLFAVSGCGGGGSDSPPATEIAFTTIEKRDSGIRNERQAVIRDSSAWTDLWAQHTSNWNPAPPLPAVDFNANMVLAVFLGTRTNGCYSVDIQRVFQQGADIMVEYHENVPAPGSICPHNIATPSHIVTVPSSTANVVFIKN